MWPALISGGLGLLGGIFDRNASREAAQTAEENKGIDYAKLRDDAIKGGFNPLTALMAGGGAGYESTFSPELSSGAFITEAISRGADTYFQGKQQADMQASQIRLNEQSIAESKANMARHVPGDFGYGLTSNAAPQFAQAPVLADPFKMRQQSMYIEVKDDVTGNTFYMVDPDLTDTGPSELLTGLGVLAAAEGGNGFYDLARAAYLKRQQASSPKPPVFLPSLPHPQRVKQPSPASYNTGLGFGGNYPYGRSGSW